MTGRIPIAVATLVAGALLAAPASAGPPGEVEVIDDQFLPRTVDTPVGDEVHWFVQAPTANDHNVLATGKLFASAAHRNDLSFNVEFTITPSAGTFPYYCFSHGTPNGQGDPENMAGTLKIRPKEAPAKRGGDVFGVEWADGSNTGDQFDVRFKGPGTHGKYKNWLKNTELESSTFGDGNEPTNVKPGKTYSIQVRSEDSSDPSKRKSGWSPPLKASIDL